MVERKSDVDLARNASHSLKLVDGIRQVTRGRVARNVSLLLVSMSSFLSYPHSNSL